MALLLLLSGLQLCVTLGVGAVLWRRLERTTREIKRLRKALGAAEAQVATPMLRRARGGDATFVEDRPRSITELRRRDPVDADALSVSAGAATLSPETMRGLSLAVAAAAPATGFFFNGGAAPIVTAALVIAAGMMLVSLRPLWRAGAWGAVMTAGAWTLTAFALHAPAQSPGIFSVGVLLAGAAGLIHAHLRRAAAGVTMAVVMSAAALALGSQIGLISAPGITYGVLVALAATIGALSMRLESVHLGAFAAGLLGLFALSGQHDAAIWFTPVTTWFGAAFFGIAALRVPELGARGLALAATGALAALGAVAALHGSHQGLDDPIAAAAAFAVLAIGFGLIVFAAARHANRGLAALGLTLWVLAGAALFALSAAVLIALPAPLAATAFAALTCGLAALDWRAGHAVWRSLAWIAGILAMLAAAQTVLLLLNEAPNWSAWLLIITGLILPALCAGAGAYCAERTPAPFAASVFETFAIVGGVLAANLTLRTLAANGALLSAPVSFAEAGLHIAIWLSAAGLLGWRSVVGAQRVRKAALTTLGALCLLGCAVIVLLWLTPHWRMRPSPALLRFAPLGYLAPALLFWAHWAFWRTRADERRMRIALGAAALMTAAFVSMLTLQARAPGVDWISGVVTALALALAMAVNFAPQLGGQPTLHFHKNFHRPRPDETRREAG